MGVFVILQSKVVLYYKIMLFGVALISREGGGGDRTVRAVGVHMCPCHMPQGDAEAGAEVMALCMYICVCVYVYV